MKPLTPLSDAAKEIIRSAELMTVGQAVRIVHGAIREGASLVASAYALKLLQEIGELREKVEPQNGDHDQIVYALERARSRLEKEADAFAQMGDYAAQFPDEDAQRMTEAIAILRKPKAIDRDNAVQSVFDCILRGINDIAILGSNYAPGWLWSWAKSLQKVGFTPSNPDAPDIKRVLERLKKDSP